MKRIGVALLLVLTVTGCQSTSSGSSASGVPKNGGTSSLGCDKDGDAIADLQTVRTGISDKTMTNADAAQQFQNMASDLKTSTEIDKYPALPIERDAEIRAGQIRVALLEPGSAGNLAHDTARLATDLSKLGNYCS